ncbi:hypothetical protein A3K73_06455 [Candidatus Pacearchaeota archaeon RBG_13_36_9]|nr:MAG: hypothetical protein A3K73_06455 [Candidatus Pacearchaeota archaeon RBG_13_36_9]
MGGDMSDSDRLEAMVESSEGTREKIPTCRTCYLFGSCSSKNPNQRADNCYEPSDQLGVGLID